MSKTKQRKATASSISRLLAQEFQRSESYIRVTSYKTHLIVTSKESA